jgi:hypothetical protein
MGSRSRRFGTALGLGLMLVACGSSSKKNDASGDGGSAGDGSASCTAGSKRCAGQDILLCNEQGDGETVARTCPAGLFCNDDNADDVTCSSLACAPNTAQCDGSIATTCKADGSGVKAGGFDCAANNQECMSGMCRNPTCKRGEKVCRNDDVYTCGEDGNSISLLVDCGTTEVCDPELGACRAKLCEPSKSSCKGSVVQTCNAAGSGYLPGSVDCADDGRMCTAGSCDVTRICEPLQRYCKGDDLYLCDLAGADETLQETCSTGMHCQPSDSGTWAYCALDECEPGEKTCVQNVLKTCTEIRSFPASGEYCGDDKYCDVDECKVRECTAGTLFCQDSNVYSCEFETAPSLYADCGDDRACKVIGGGSEGVWSTALCMQRPCIAGTTACMLNKIGTCGADGDSLTSVTSDCAANDDVCSADGKCAASTTDTLGLDESGEVLYSGGLVGNLIEARSARMVTELQMWLVISSPRELRWVIYEQSGSSFVAKVDKVVTAPAGTGFVSSGANSFSFQVQAGKQYLFAMVPTADVFGYYDTAPFAGNASFATVLGRVVAGYTSMISVNDYYQSESLSYMKIMTKLP